MRRRAERPRYSVNRAEAIRRLDRAMRHPAQNDDPMQRAIRARDWLRWLGLTWPVRLMGKDIEITDSHNGIVIRIPYVPPSQQAKET